MTDTGELSDAQIVSSILKGNRELFRLLIQRHQQQVRMSIQRIIFNHNDVDDLVQETLIKTFKSLNKYNPKWAFSTWIATIATRTALDAVRKHKVRNAVDLQAITLEMMNDTNEDPTERATQNQFLDRIREEIEGLSEKMRIIFGLHYIDGMSINQIAEFLEAKPTTVKVTLHRTRQLLRDKLKEVV